MSKRRITNKNENERIQQTVVEYVEAQEKFREIEKQYNEKRKSLQTTIRNFMYTNGFNSFNFLAHHGRFKGNEVPLRVLDVKPKRIEFDVEALEEKVDKELLNEFLDKKYVIINMQGLIKYLKSCGVNPKKFKKFIEVEKTVNKQKLDELSELGEITLDDLKGCYEIKESEGYIKISEVKETE